MWGAQWQLGGVRTKMFPLLAVGAKLRFPHEARFLGSMFPEKEWDRIYLKPKGSGHELCLLCYSPR